jgi:hypothetical protein
MSKDMNDIFIKLIENLDVKMTNLTTDVAKTHTDLALIKQTLERVEGQTIKTNGRVTKLEDSNILISKAHAQLTDIVSKQNGIYEQNLLDLKNNITTRGTEINEIKKLMNTENIGEIEIKKINTEVSGRLKVQIVAGVISIITIIATAFLSFRAGENKTPELLPTINNTINK